MRQTIFGWVAATAMVTASIAPAMACGGGLFQGPCSPCGPAYQSPCAAYERPAPVVPSCDSGCGSGYERLSDPERPYGGPRQYYYANQGPTFSGPGDFAPYPTYQESAVSGWNAYRRRPYYYGYDGGRYADATTHYYDGAGVDGPAIYRYPARRRLGYWHGNHGVWVARPSVRYGYAPHHGMPYGERVLRRYD